MPGVSEIGADEGRRRALVAALAAGLAPVVPGVLSGCRGRPEGEIEFWTLALRPWFDDYIAERLDAFGAERAGKASGTRVTWVDVPFEALQRKLMASASAGRPPDVVNMSDLNFARFAGLGALRPLDDVIPGDAGARYLAGALGLCRLAGPGGRRRLMGVPWYVTPQVTIVNRRLVEAGGLRVADVPLRWRGLLGLAGEFRRRTGGFLLSQSLGDESQILIMMMGDGVSPLRVEHGRLRGALSRGPALEYAALWVGAYREGALPRAAGTTGHKHLIEMYQGGRLGLICTGPSFLSRIEGAAPGVYAESEVAEGVTGSLGRGHLPVMILGVGAGTRDAEAAAALAWFMTSPESQTEFCRRAAIMPSSLASLSDPYFAGLDGGGGVGLAERGRRIAASGLTRGTAFTVSHESWPELRRLFEAGMKRVLLNGAELAAEMKRVDAEWDEVLSAGPAVGLEVMPMIEGVRWGEGQGEGGGGERGGSA
ncbi:MAG: extracellular solute-binding protein [Phycisphaeraceae bacterium]|nr:MAG: extracellular solute-binding protein [Phycisphaeraceae bacterium]